MDVSALFRNLFATPAVKCSQKEEVGLDDPAFANMDPHLKVDESDDEEFQGQDPTRPKHSRKPPPFHGIFNNVKAITSKVEHIKGFKFELTTPISQRFFLNHSWVIPYSGADAPPSGPKAQMGMAKPPPTSTYTLSTQYVGGPKEDLMTTGPKYILSARMDSKGKLDASYLRFFNKQWNLQFHSQFPFGSDVKNAQVNADLNYEDEDCTTTIKYTTGAVGFGHVQTIGDRTVIGFESIFGTMQNLTMLNYSAKFALNRRNTLYGNYSAAQDQANLAYQLLVNKNCRIVSELTYRLSEGTTQTVIGFRMKLNESETIAAVSSKGKLSTAISLMGMGYSLKLCAVADYLKDSYKFGYGISLGGQQLKTKEEQLSKNNNPASSSSSSSSSQQSQIEVEEPLQQSQRIPPYSRNNSNRNVPPLNLRETMTLQDLASTPRQQMTSSTVRSSQARSIDQQLRAPIPTAKRVISLDLDSDSSGTQQNNPIESVRQSRAEQKFNQKQKSKQSDAIPMTTSTRVVTQSYANSKRSFMMAESSSVEEEMNESSDMISEDRNYSYDKAFDIVKKRKQEQAKRFLAQREEDSKQQPSFSAPFNSKMNRIVELSHFDQIAERKIQEKQQAEVAAAAAQEQSKNLLASTAAPLINITPPETSQQPAASTSEKTTTTPVAPSASTGGSSLFSNLSQKPTIVTTATNDKQAKEQKPSGLFNELNASKQVAQATAPVTATASQELFISNGLTRKNSKQVEPLTSQPTTRVTIAPESIVIKTTALTSNLAASSTNLSSATSSLFQKPEDQTTSTPALIKEQQPQLPPKQSQGGLFSSLSSIGGESKPVTTPSQPSTALPIATQTAAPPTTSGGLFSNLTSQQQQPPQTASLFSKTLAPSTPLTTDTKAAERTVSSPQTPPLEKPSAFVPQLSQPMFAQKIEIPTKKEPTQSLSAGPSATATGLFNSSNYTSVSSAPAKTGLFANGASSPKQNGLFTSNNTTQLHKPTESSSTVTTSEPETKPQSTQTSLFSMIKADQNANRPVEAQGHNFSFIRSTADAPPQSTSEEKPDSSIKTTSVSDSSQKINLVNQQPQPQVVAIASPQEKTNNPQTQQASDNQLSSPPILPASQPAATGGLFSNNTNSSSSNSSNGSGLFSGLSKVNTPSVVPTTTNKSDTNNESIKPEAEKQEIPLANNTSLFGNLEPKSVGTSLFSNLIPQVPTQSSQPLKTTEDSHAAAAAAAAASTVTATQATSPAPTTGLFSALPVQSNGSLFTNPKTISDGPTMLEPSSGIVSQKLLPPKSSGTNLFSQLQNSTTDAASKPATENSNTLLSIRAPVAPSSLQSMQTTPAAEPAPAAAATSDVSEQKSIFGNSIPAPNSSSQSKGGLFSLPSSGGTRMFTSQLATTGKATTITPFSSFIQQPEKPKVESLASQAGLVTSAPSNSIFPSVKPAGSGGLFSKPMGLGAAPPANGLFSSSTPMPQSGLFSNNSASQATSSVQPTSGSLFSNLAPQQSQLPLFPLSQGSMAGSRFGTQ